MDRSPRPTEHRSLNTSPSAARQNSSPNGAQPARPAHPFDHGSPV